MPMGLWHNAVVLRSEKNICRKKTMEKSIVDSRNHRIELDIYATNNVIFVA